MEPKPLLWEKVPEGGEEYFMVEGTLCPVSRLEVEAAVTWLKNQIGLAMNEYPYIEKAVNEAFNLEEQK